MKARQKASFAVVQLLLLLMLPAIFSERTYGQTADLIAAAKKEGEVTVFGSLENDVAAAINKGFEAKHGIKTNYFRGSSTVIIDRITSEHRTGKMTSDVVYTTAEPMKFINKEKGLLARYVSPSAKDYDKKLIDDFFGPNYRSVIIGFVYNTSMIKPEDAPKSYEDIVNPKWKGKIAMGNPSLHDTTIDWLASLHFVFGSTQKANDWIKRLAALEPLTARLHGASRRAHCVGRSSLGYCLREVRSSVESKRRADGLRERTSRIFGRRQLHRSHQQSAASQCGKAFPGLFSRPGELRDNGQRG